MVAAGSGHNSRAQYSQRRLGYSELNWRGVEWVGSEWSG